MKLVIVQMDSVHVGNASWTCFQLPEETSEQAFLLQGHRVVEVSEEQGNEIIAAMGASLRLQFVLRDLYHPPKPVENAN